MTIKSHLISEKKNLKTIGLILIILFIINPFFAFLITLTNVFIKKKLNKADYILLMITLAGWISVINMTKIPSGDQIYYADIYMKVDTSNLFKSIINYREDMESKNLSEICFAIFSVCCNLITNANPRAYFFLISFTCYLLYFLAIYNMLKNTSKKHEIVATIILMAFFTPKFNYTLHLIRQELANAIIIYAISYRAIYKKNNWLMIGIAIFMHNSSILYAIFSLIPLFYKKLKNKKLIILLVLFYIFELSIGYISNLTESINLEAIHTNIEGAINSGKSQTESELYSERTMIIYSIPLLIWTLIIYYKEKQGKESPIIPFTYIFTLTFMLIITLNTMPTLQYRYLSYIYSIFPLIICYGSKSKLQLNLWLIIICIFFTFRFYFIDNFWIGYDSLSNIISHSFLYYWNTAIYYI